MKNGRAKLVGTYVVVSAFSYLFLLGAAWTSFTIAQGALFLGLTLLVVSLGFSVAFSLKQAPGPVGAIPATPKLKPIEQAIQYTIVTAPRKENYLQQLIDNMHAVGFFNNPDNLPLRIVAGIPESQSEYLKPYMHQPDRFQVDLMEEAEARKILWYDAGKALRATMGHRRCLEPDRTRPGCRYVMVMEDDIKFAFGWQSRFFEIMRMTETTYKDRFLLSLYTPGSTMPLEAYKSGKPWIMRDPRGFFGIQAVVYPLWVRDEFTRITEETPTMLPHDLSLGKVLGQIKVPILSTTPCLVQHVGESSGADSPKHGSLSFIDRIGEVEIPHQKRPS